MAFVKDGRGLINVNGAPIENVEPELLRYKILEPVLLLNQDTFSKVRFNFASGGVWDWGGLAMECCWASRCVGHLAACFLLFLPAHPAFSTNTQVDIRVRVKGGGHTAQIYAIRQAIAKGIVAFYQKCESLLLASHPLG